MPFSRSSTSMLARSSITCSPSIEFQAQQFEMQALGPVTRFGPDRPGGETQFAEEARARRRRVHQYAADGGLSAQVVRTLQHQALAEPPPLGRRRSHHPAELRLAPFGIGLDAAAGEERAALID